MTPSRICRPSFHGIKNGTLPITVARHTDRRVLTEQTNERFGQSPPSRIAGPDHPAHSAQRTRHIMATASCGSHLRSEIPMLKQSMHHGPEVFLPARASLSLHSLWRAAAACGQSRKARQSALPIDTLARCGHALSPTSLRLHHLGTRWPAVLSAVPGAPHENRYAATRRRPKMTALSCPSSSVHGSFPITRAERLPRTGRFDGAPGQHQSFPGTESFQHKTDGDAQLVRVHGAFSATTTTPTDEHSQVSPWTVDQSPKSGPRTGSSGTISMVQTSQDHQRKLRALPMNRQHSYTASAYPQRALPPHRVAP